MSFTRRIFCVGFTCLASFAPGQSAPSTRPSTPATPGPPLVQVAIPTEPGALLTLARSLNGIEPTGGAPWHLKATFEVFDEKGVVKEKGTFEEFHISEDKYKVVVSSPSYSQTEVSNDRGAFVSGERHLTMQAAALVRENLLVAPPPEKQLESMRLT